MKEKFGRCLGCNRLLPMCDLEEIEFYDGHDTKTKSFHHKLICSSCKHKAYEVYHSGEDSMYEPEKIHKMIRIIEEKQKEQEEQIKALRRIIFDLLLKRDDKKRMEAD